MNKQIALSERILPVARSDTHVLTQRCRIWLQSSILQVHKPLARCAFATALLGAGTLVSTLDTGNDASSEIIASAQSSLARPSPAKCNFPPSDRASSILGLSPLHRLCCFLPAAELATNLSQCGTESCQKARRWFPASAPVPLPRFWATSNFFGLCQPLHALCQLTVRPHSMQTSSCDRQIHPQPLAPTPVAVPLPNHCRVFHENSTTTYTCMTAHIRVQGFRSDLSRVHYFSVLVSGCVTHSRAHTHERMSITWGRSFLHKSTYNEV